MTRLCSRLPAATAGPRVPPSSLQHRLTGKITMSQLLLAILTLSGLLPNAEVLTVGAEQGPGFVYRPPPRELISSVRYFEVIREHNNLELRDHLNRELEKQVTVKTQLFYALQAKPKFDIAVLPEFENKQ
ncbi:low-density lipoprotein receptor-related protein 1B precursor [Cricetulus griseus]|nr:low-density lipoprotein receptor-related protein 1B precursor [Cricetulus griseus]